MAFFKPEDIISTYTEDQAIEDGFKADLGFFKTSFGRVRITTTTGFIKEMNALQAMHILLKTIGSIHPKTPTWIIFKNGKDADHSEDEGRTLVTHMRTDKKVYAILDNHGAHYVLTFLLAEEY